MYSLPSFVYAFSCSSGYPLHRLLGHVRLVSVGRQSSIGNWLILFCVLWCRRTPGGYGTHHHGGIKALAGALAVLLLERHSAIMAAISGKWEAAALVALFCATDSFRRWLAQTTTRRMKKRRFLTPWRPDGWSRRPASMQNKGASLKNVTPADYAALFHRKFLWDNQLLCCYALPHFRSAVSSPSAPGRRFSRAQHRSCSAGDERRRRRGSPSPSVLKRHCTTRYMVNPVFVPVTWNGAYVGAAEWDYPDTTWMPRKEQYPLCTDWPGPI